MTVEAAQPRVEARARAGVAADRGVAAVGPLVLALDLGASRIRAGVVAADGRVVARASRRTPLDSDQRELLAACAALLEGVRRRLPVEAARRLTGLGVAAPGPLDATTGYLLEPPNMGHVGRGLPLGPHLARATDLPVAVERDTNVAALAEQAFGRARGVRDFLYLTVSTGVGGAIVADGHLLRGPDGLAGELGHVPVDLDGPLCGCGARGHLEALASGSGIAAQAAAALAAGTAPGLAAFLAAHAEAPATPGARLVAAAEEAGDPTATAIMARARRAFAAALVGFVDVFNPHLIVVGGSLARAQGERWLGPAREAIATLAFPSAAARVRLVAAALGDDVGLAGAVPLLRLSPAQPDPRPVPASAALAHTEVPPA